MLRKFVCAAIVMVLALAMLSGGALVGGDKKKDNLVRGIATKFEGDKEKGTITLYSFKKVDDKFEKGDEQTIKTNEKTVFQVRVGKDKDKEPEASTHEKFKETIEGSKGKFKGSFVTIELVEGSKDTAAKVTYRIFRKKKVADEASDE